MPYFLVSDPSGLLLFFLEVSLKGSLVLAAAGLATSLLRKFPAAVRHTIWTTAIVAVAILPFIVAYAPRMDVGILPSEDLAVAPQPTSAAEPMAIDEIPAVADEAVAAPVASERINARRLARAARIDRARARKRAPRAVVEVGADAGVPLTASVSALPAVPTPTSPPFDWKLGLLLLWATGVAVVYFRYLIGWVALRRIKKRSEPVADVRFRLAAIKVARSMGLRRRVRFVWGDANGMPLTYGWIAPTVLLPTDAREWSAEKIIAVLKHELAHIKRSDCLIQCLVYLVCAIHWFNPLVWVAAAGSRREREMACDDYVINTGTDGTTYADHLLEIARSLRTPAVSGVSTIAMARRTELEGRLISILSPSQRRHANTRLGVLATVAMLAVFAIPIAALRPVPAETTSGAVIANADPDSDADSKSEPRQNLRALTLQVDQNRQQQRRNEQRAKASRDARREIRKRAKEAASASATVAASASAVASVTASVDVPSVDVAVDAEKVKFDAAVSLETQQYLEEVNKIIEKAAKTLESLERLEPTVSAWQAEFGNYGEPGASPGLDQMIVDPDTIPLAQIKRLKAAGVDVEYIESLAEVGLNHLTIDQLISLAHAGIDADYVRAMCAAGYDNLQPDELIQLGFAGVQPEDIAVWAAMGYDDLTTNDLIRLAHADVDADFIATMAELGYKDLGPDQLVRMSHADVDPEFIAEMRQAGYPDLTADEMVRLAHADIDAEFIRELSQFGLQNLSADDLVRLGHADVDAEFIQAMRSVGYTDLTADELIRMSHADVDPAFVAELSAAGYRDISVDQLIRLGHAGVDADFIAEMRKAGLQNLDVEDLIRLRHADVDAGFIDELKEIGFEVNDVDEIVRLRYLDIDPSYIKRVRKALENTQDAQ